MLRTCKFCGETKKLIDAHVIPKSLLALDSPDRQPSRLLTNAKGKYAQKVPKGVYDSGIVCLECERRFSPWDDYAHELLLKSWDDMKLIAQNERPAGLVRENYDYARLKLFFMSVLWRAGASAHRMFEKVNLGQHEQLLREALSNSDPGDPNFFGVMLQAFDTQEVGILDPHPERFFGLRFYRIYIRQLIVFVKVDSRPMPDPFSSVCLAPSRPLITTLKNFITSPERKIMRDLVMSDMAARGRVLRPS